MNLFLLFHCFPFSLSLSLSFCFFLFLSISRFSPDLFITAVITFISRDREQPHVLSRPIYIPAQFENSLGKLQFASVIAPRKVIDMDVVPNSDPQLTTQIQQKDTKRTRQLLLEIERVLAFSLVRLISKRFILLSASVYYMNHYNFSYI